MMGRRGKRKMMEEGKEDDGGGGEKRKKVGEGKKMGRAKKDRWRRERRNMTGEGKEGRCRERVLKYFMGISIVVGQN